MEQRYPVVNLGQFEAVPLSPEDVAERRPYAMVPLTTLAFGVYGPYFNPGRPEWGRFAVLPPGAPPLAALGQTDEVRRAGLLLLRSDGWILFLRRSSSVRLPGAWDLPGGHVEPGETDWEGALRECGEEIGGVPRMRILGTRRRREDRLVYTTFIAESLDGDWSPRLDWEHDRWAWFPPGEPPAPLRPAAETLLGELGLKAGPGTA